MNKLVSLLLTLCTINSACAGVQKFNLDEEKHVAGFISAREMNRIKIQGERISEIIGLASNFSVESDEINGQLFLKATGKDPGAQRAEFSIVTESGKTQDFRLVVKPNIEGQILLIENNQQKELSLSNQIIGAKNIRHEEIILLIRKAHDLPDLPKKNRSYKKNNMEIALVNQVNSGKYQVQIWEIKNIGNIPIALEEKQFALDGKTMAIAIQNRLLNGGEKSKIFKVIQYV
jgi:hypothetical protein